MNKLSILLQALNSKELKKLLQESISAKSIIEAVQDKVESLSGSLSDSFAEAIGESFKDVEYYKRRIKALEGLVEAQQHVISELSK